MIQIKISYSGNNIFNTESVFYPLLFCAFGMYFYVFSLIGLDLAYLPGDLGDGRLNNYFLEHCYLFFKGGVPSFWDAGFMYPEPKSLTFSDNLLGTSFLYYLPRIIGYSRETSFQVWFILIHILNFISCWYVINKLVKNSLIASLAAYIFVFSLSSIPQLMHAQLLPKFPLVFGIYFLVEFLRDGKISSAIYFYLFLLLQFLCGMYLGIFLLYTAMILFVSHLFIKPIYFNYKNIRARQWLYYSLVFISLTLAYYYFLYPYYERSISSGYVADKDMIDNSPTFSSYFYVLKGSLLWEKLFVLSPPNRELWNFSGLVSLGLVIMSYFVKTTVYEIRLARVALALIFITTLKIGEFPIYLVLSKCIPGLGAIRGLSRISLVEMFFVGFLASWTLLHYSTKYPYLKVWLFCFGCFVLLLENKVTDFSLYRTSKLEAQNRITDLANKFKIHQTNKQNYKALAYLPGPNPGIEYTLHLDAMILSQDLGVPCINAYTSKYPKHFEYFHYAMECSTLNNWLKNNGTDNALKINEILILNAVEPSCK